MLGRIIINSHLSIAESELDWCAVRSQGAGGQNVNKVASAIHLRFSIPQSSLPTHIKDRLLASNDGRVTREGVLVIKAQRFRTQELNRKDALARLEEIIRDAARPQKIRKATKPSFGAKLKRLHNKNHRAQLKSRRGKVSDY